MGFLVFIVFIVVIVAMARRYAKLDNERISARIRAEREEEIKREKKEERLQQQRKEDAGLSESCLQFAQRMKEHPMIVEEGQKLLQDDRPSGRIFSKTSLQTAENAL